MRLRVSTGQLDKSTWQTVFCNIPSSSIAAANREVTRILQARNPEVKRSKKRGAYQKYSAEERTTFQETKIVLYSIFGKCSTVMQTGYRSSMLAWSHWQFSSYLMFEFHLSLYKMSPDATGSYCNCFVTHHYWK